MINRYHFLLKGLPLTIIILVGCILQESAGKEVSFFIPQDHEQYAYFDSLFKVIESTGLKAEALEKKVIKEKGMLGSNMKVKEQYFDHLLKNKLSTKTKILDYCRAAKKNYEAKEQYFDKLLPIMKGDDRANCFLYLKHARGELSKVTGIIDTYTASSDDNINVIEYNTKEKLTIEEPEIKDPSLDDILGTDDEDEDPFKDVDESK